MAGNKRALSQIDGNVTNSQPPPKRKSQRAGKENADSDYTGMKKLDLCTLLQQRNLPYSGIKDVLIRRLEDSDKDHPSEASSERATVERLVSAQPVEHAFEYLMLCRPLDDIRTEKDAKNLNDVTSKELGEEEVEEYSELDNDLPASEDPEHRWILTPKGYQLIALLRWEVAIRDQDAFDEYFYNDYNGYGFQEAMENQLLFFNREFSRGRTQEGGASPAALWSIIEGFAWVLNEPEYWFHCDDPDTVLATLQLIGGAVFTTLNTLEKNGLLRSDSPVKNIALVLGVLYNNTRDWPGGEEPELEWRGAMIREVQRHGIEVKGQPYGIEGVLKQDGVDGTPSSRADSRWKMFDWAKRFKAFSKKYRKGSSIGGRHYVLASQKQLAMARKTLGSMSDL
ncbi:uncharacterized protein PV07_07209 [Cladophialophora immunda]|uniref:SAP domain-containing protein n=1 Tax=Cladophialophora immunda TaxID=569365 RepID=A0A0D2CAK5_9EURO|nr:uncharacterized protein PV07_07209 [Cladophialophora immunda]KIW27475.1 hypothetical protein PV07_07209 [Cladophialophora immunda]